MTFDLLLFIHSYYWVGGLITFAAASIYIFFDSKENETVTDTQLYVCILISVIWPVIWFITLMILFGHVWAFIMGRKFKF